MSETSELTTNPVGTVPAELESEIARSGLGPESTQALLSAYAPHFVAFLGLENDAQCCPRDDPKRARELRLKVRAVRITAEKERKELKEDSLRRGQVIDRINRLLLDRLKPVEESLDRIERAEEIARQERIAALIAARQERLAPYAEHVTGAELANLGVLTEMQFEAMLSRAMASHEERERLVEARRLEQEQLDREEREEREKLRAENERLAVIAAKERQDRESAEAELARKALSEREAREKAEAEEAARIADERRAAAAPDRDKMLHFAGTIRALPVPEFESADGCALAAELDTMIERLARWCEKFAEELA